MKKRTIKVLLLVLIVILVSGCGKKAEEIEKTQSLVSESVVEETNDATEEVVAHDVQSEEGEVTEIVKDSLFLNVNVKNVKKVAADEERNRYQIVTVEYDNVELDEADAKRFPELAKTLADVNSKNDDEFDSEYSRLKDVYMEFETDVANDDFYLRYEYTYTGDVIRADKAVLSIARYFYMYEGGAHGYYTKSGEAYDVATGKRIELGDLVVDKSAFVDLIKKKLVETYPDTYFFADLDTYFDNEIYSGERELSWSIDYNGVTVYFQPYELASYADGILYARFSFDEHSSIFNEKYLPVTEDYVMPLKAWTDKYVDIDNDGHEDIVYVYNTSENDWDTYEWRVRIGEETLPCVSLGYTNESYLVKKSGKYYIYMFNSVENDYGVLHIIDLQTKEQLGDEYGFDNYGLYGFDYEYDSETSKGTIKAFVNPEEFALESRMDVLGTYSAARNYSISDDGIPVSDDEFFDTRVSFLISATKDIKCKIVDVDGHVVEENATLPAGTMLRIIRTNDKNIVDVQAGDYTVEDNEYYSEEYPYWYTDDPLDLNRGTIYRLEYKQIDYEKSIGGESIFDLFKGMMFAG